MTLFALITWSGVFTLALFTATFITGVMEYSFLWHKTLAFSGLSAGIVHFGLILYKQYKIHHKKVIK
ncbi:MAG: hypothetical protein WCS77_06060 [Elusimicrobiaceae bacterium]|jgi:hypothetical protein